MPGHEKEESLTLQEANNLEWRDLDVVALEAEIAPVWEAITNMQDAQTVSNETLSREISI